MKKLDGNTDINLNPNFLHNKRIIFKINFTREIELERNFLKFSVLTFFMN